MVCTAGKLMMANTSFAFRLFVWYQALILMILHIWGKTAQKVTEQIQLLCDYKHWGTDGRTKERDAFQICGNGGATEKTLFFFSLQWFPTH